MSRHHRGKRGSRAHAWVYFSHYVPLNLPLFLARILRNGAIASVYSQRIWYHFVANLQRLRLQYQHPKRHFVGLSQSFEVDFLSTTQLTSNFKRFPYLESSKRSPASRPLSHATVGL